MNTYATVVLAAGKGTRMRSTLPKMLHPLAGSPLLAHVWKAIEATPSSLVLLSETATTLPRLADAQQPRNEASFASLVSSTFTYPPIVVLGHEAAQYEAAFGSRCLYAFQKEQLGTAD